MTTPDRQAGGPPPLPGDCRSIPQVKTEVRDDHGNVRWIFETHVVGGLDLDGHGSPVVLVPPHRDVHQNSMWWRLFIQRGDCGHELGIVIGMGEPVRDPEKSHGLYNFTVVESVASVSAVIQGIGATTYVFDGERYTGGRTEYQ